MYQVLLVADAPYAALTLKRAMAISEMDSFMFTTLSLSPKLGKDITWCQAAICALFARTVTRCFMRNRLHSQLRKCETFSVQLVILGCKSSHTGTRLSRWRPGWPTCIH